MATQTNNNNITVPCSICGNPRYKVLFRDHNRRGNVDCSGTYVQCSVVYLQERPPWDEIVKFYTLPSSDNTVNGTQADVGKLRQLAQKPTPKWKQLLRKVLFRPHSWPLESVSQGNKHFLDIGCSTGTKLIEFAKRGYNVWGVDVDADAIAICKELLPRGHFIQGELQEIDLPAGYFDYIRIDNALEHMPNPQEVVRTCYRLLKDQGKLLIYIPHGRSLSMRLMKGNSISSWIPFHLQLFTRKSLVQLLEHTGFSDIRIYGYYPISWLPLSLLQWKNRGGKISYSKVSGWLNAVLYPFGWLFAKIGLAEKLVAVAVKND